MDRARLLSFRLFALMLGIWTGAGVYETIYSHSGWYADPSGWLRSAAPPGAVNPWPVLTVLVALSTLAALALDWRGRAAGRLGLVAILGALAVLAATGLYFVPSLITLEGHAAMEQAAVAAMSRTWIRLNLVRIPVLLALFYAALAALGRHGAGSLPSPAER